MNSTLFITQPDNDTALPLMGTADQLAELLSADRYEIVTNQWGDEGLILYTLKHDDEGYEYEAKSRTIPSYAFVLDGWIANIIMNQR